MSTSRQNGQFRGTQIKICAALTARNAPWKQSLWAGGLGRSLDVRCSLTRIRTLSASTGGGARRRRQPSLLFCNKRSSCYLVYAMFLILIRLIAALHVNDRKIFSKKVNDSFSSAVSLTVDSVLKVVKYTLRYWHVSATFKSYQRSLFILSITTLLRKFLRYRYSVCRVR